MSPNGVLARFLERFCYSCHQKVHLNEHFWNKFSQKLGGTHHIFAENHEEPPTQ
jgi:hypothetical protein